MRVAIYASSATGDRTAEEKARECRKFALSKGWQIVSKYVCTSAESKEEHTLNSLLDEAQGEPRPFDGLLIPDPDTLCARPRETLAVLQRLRDLGIELIFVSLQTSQTDKTRILQHGLEDLFRCSEAFHSGLEEMMHRFAARMHDIESAYIRCGSLAFSMLSHETSILCAVGGVERPQFTLQDLARLFPRYAHGTANAARTTFLYMQVKIDSGRGAHNQHDDREKEQVYKELESFGCERSTARDFIEGRLCKRYTRQLLEEYLPPFFPDHDPETIRRYFNLLPGRRIAGAAT